MLKRLARSGSVRQRLGRLIELYLDLALRTTRWQIWIPPAAAPFILDQPGQAAIIAFWHEHLPLIPVLLRHARRRNPSLAVSVLTSRHRDGQMITEIVRRWDVGTIAGSSDSRRRSGSAGDKGGAAAMRQMVGLLREGTLVGITPDGPRGPRRTLQPGLARLAALSGAPVIAVAGECRPYRRLRSWDRMLLPLPFGRGRLVCSEPVHVTSRDWPDAVPAIEEALRRVSRQADGKLSA